MTLDGIIEILKNYCFDNKMELCYKLCLAEYRKYKNKKFGEVFVYPHELEVFAVLSILAKYENEKKLIDGDFMPVFNEMINLIKKFVPPAYKLGIKNIRYYVSNLQINQFSLQEDYFINFYRYNYFFNFCNNRIDMKSEFFKKFDVNYDEVLSLGSFLCLCSISISKELPRVYFEKILKFHPNAARLLTIERVNYIDIQMDLFNHKVENCLMGFKLFFQYPFISQGDFLYYPIPYAIKDACTSSLLYRLTEGNNKLRELVGKEVLENYIHFIHSSNNVYSEIQGEFVYKIGKKEFRSPDLMLRTNNKVVLMDIKSSVPSTNFRELNPKIQKEVSDKMANNVVQIFKNIKKFCAKEFGFKSNTHSNLVDTYGVVIVLEDNYLDREEIANIACARLKIEINDPMYKFIHANIRILGLSEIEMLALDSTNIIDVLEFISNSPQRWYDFSFRGMQFNWAKKTSKDFKNFKTRTIKNIENISFKIETD